MNGIQLGRLEPVAPREVWMHEERDFTPWLLDHADRLAEALGIELEFTSAEHPVGPHELDLIGRDLTHDAVLIVENQLEATDHGHLGQLLTYAAGTAAATIVWVATRMREEHRQALDWLNQETGEDTRFFGVELQVVRIGSSAPAPLLNVVAEHGLKAHRSLLEEHYGCPLEFMALPERRASRVAEHREDVDVAEVDRHEDYVNWFFDAGTRLRTALAALPPHWESDVGGVG